MFVSFKMFCAITAASSTAACFTATSALSSFRMSSSSSTASSRAVWRVKRASESFAEADTAAAVSSAALLSAAPSAGSVSGRTPSSFIGVSETVST